MLQKINSLQEKIINLETLKANFKECKQNNQHLKLQSVKDKLKIENFEKEIWRIESLCRDIKPKIRLKCSKKCQKQLHKMQEKLEKIDLTEIKISFVQIKNKIESMKNRLNVI